MATNHDVHRIPVTQVGSEAPLGRDTSSLTFFPEPRFADDAPPPEDVPLPDDEPPSDDDVPTPDNDVPTPDGDVPTPDDAFPPRPPSAALVVHPSVMRPSSPSNLPSPPPPSPRASTSSPASSGNPPDWPNAVNDRIFAEAYNNILAGIAPTDRHPRRNFHIHQPFRFRPDQPRTIPPHEDHRPSSIRKRYILLARAQQGVCDASYVGSAACDGPAWQRTETRPMWIRPRPPRVMVTRGMAIAQENIRAVLHAAGASGKRHDRRIDQTVDPATRFYMKGLLSILPFLERLQLDLGWGPRGTLEDDENWVDARDGFERGLDKREDREYWLSTLRDMILWLEEVIANEHPVLDRDHIVRAKVLKSKAKRLYMAVRNKDPQLRKSPLPEFIEPRKAQGEERIGWTGRLAAAGARMFGWMRFTATEEDRRDLKRWLTM